LGVVFEKRFHLASMAGPGRRGAGSRRRALPRACRMPDSEDPQ
jgi:hypothetical protein